MHDVPTVEGIDPGCGEDANCRRLCRCVHLALFVYLSPVLLVVLALGVAAYTLFGILQAARVCRRAWRSLPVRLAPVYRPLGLRLPAASPGMLPSLGVARYGRYNQAWPAVGEPSLVEPLGPLN